MFKFDFKVDTEEETSEIFKDGKAEAASDKTSDSPALDWYAAEQVNISEDALDNLDVCKLNAIVRKVNEVSICYMVSGFLLEDIKENQDDKDLDLKKAEDSHSDLIPAVYEGGAKIWECTDDLLEYLGQHFSREMWKEMEVLDLGCGSGLLGIYALKCGAKVTFQDYNKDVLQKITIPNVLMNSAHEENENAQTYDLEEIQQRATFFCGDWQKWSEFMPKDKLYDIILTSETIYNPNNQEKLLTCLHERLKPDGKVLVAAKTYYFGVGGGLRQFEDLVLRGKRFQCKPLWKSTEGVNREIVQLTRIKE